MFIFVHTWNIGILSYSNVDPIIIRKLTVQIFQSYCDKIGTDKSFTTVGTDGVNFYINETDNFLGLTAFKSYEKRWLFGVRFSIVFHHYRFLLLPTITNLFFCFFTFFHSSFLSLSLYIYIYIYIYLLIPFFFSSFLLYLFIYLFIYSFSLISRFCLSVSILYLLSPLLFSSLLFFSFLFHQLFSSTSSPTVMKTTSWYIVQSVSMPLQLHPRTCVNG